MIRCVTSLKSEHFEFEDEPPKKNKRKGKKSEKKINNIFYQGFYLILLSI
jgi:hypothetical protein